MKIEEFDCEVDDIDEMSDALSAQLDSFCESIESKDGMTREIDEDDSAEMKEYCSFAWTSAAMKLIQEERGRLSEIALNYFPDEDAEIESSMCREF